MSCFAPEGWCLESLRVAKGISLEEISKETKLKLTFLRAIEVGNFDDLPGGVYNISYIRQFARAIGADESHVLRSYYRARRPAEAGADSSAKE